MNPTGSSHRTINRRPDAIVTRPAPERIIVDLSTTDGNNGLTISATVGPDGILRYRLTTDGATIMDRS